jgi:DinB superfamily
VNEYQQLLLNALTERDPAVVQAETPANIRALVALAGEDLRTRPQPSEWSVYQCIAHIADAELVISGRYRWILAHEEPEILPYDQDLWVNRFHHDQEEDVESVMELFEALRRADIALWRRTPASDRARFGVHRERGPESYELTFKLTAGHDLVHMDQAHKTLDQVRATRS